MHNQDDITALAHDIRSILRPALSSAETLSELGNPGLHEHRSEICAAIRRTVSLCDRRLKKSDLPHVETRASSHLSTIVVDALNQAISEPLDNLSVNITLLGEERINVDKNAITRVLFCLLRSAACGIADFGGEIDLNVCARNGLLTAKVSDNGPGLPDHLLDQIIMDFLNCPHPADAEGSGLRAAAYEVKQLDGNIVLASTGPAGTSLRVSIPYAY